MNPKSHIECSFEDRVEHDRLERGGELAQRTYWPEQGPDAAELDCGDQSTEELQFDQRLASEIDSGGFDIRRQGANDTGVAIDLSCFGPGHTRAADALHDHHTNVLIARQLRYSSRNADKRVGCAPSGNGVPDGDRGHRGARSRFGSGVVRGRP